LTNEFFWDFFKVEERWNGEGAGRRGSAGVKKRREVKRYWGV